MPTDAAPLPTGPAPVDEFALVRLARHVKLTFDAARQRYVLLAPETVSVLNDTGATILDLCDGRRTVAQIVAELRTRYDHVAADEVRAFLAALAARRWLEIHRG